MGSGNYIRREFLRFFPLGAAAPALSRLALSSPAPLNSVFVLVDDMGWADAACYGSTFHNIPNIDRLAAPGTRFTNAYAACPVCSPTRASIMSGKYPVRLHITDWIPGDNGSGILTLGWGESCTPDRRHIAEPAPKRVLSYAEARPTNRLMFLETAAKELVLEFRSLSPDGRSLTFAVVDRPVTKAADRAADDTLAVERARPRAQTPFRWNHGNFDTARAQAKQSGRKLIIDFETTWCGPCKSMDDWIWTDAEVAALLNAGFVGVKLDGDVEKELVKRFAVAGYPTVLILDASGKETLRFAGYRASKEVLELLNPKR